MKNIFFISDTHFGDQKICDLRFPNGDKYRPWDKAGEMDESLIFKWNNIVGKNDLVYHLGDVAVDKERLKLLKKCNGEKILIKGNKDKLELFNYATYFSDIKSYHSIEKFILTHVPLFPACIKKGRINMHGHLHRQKIKSLKYLNVSVERINYQPISIDEINQKLYKTELYSLFVDW